MKTRQRLVAATAVLLMLCLAGSAAAQTGYPGPRERERFGGRYGTTNDHGLTGVVQSTNQRLNYFTVRDEASGRSIKVDVRQMDTGASVNVWRLRAGDRVVVDGVWKDRDTFRADRVVPDAGRGRGDADANSVRGVVQSLNRRLNYFTVRDQTGRDVKIDVRRMDSDGSVDPWQIRPGDRVVVDGSWQNRDTFTADRINFPGRIRRDRGREGATLLNGVVQSTNRKLNYFTVRDQATARTVKIDVREMDTERSFNVWRLRAGDRVTVDGSWENGDTFQANTVKFGR